jgi:hypothetical protein
VPSCGLNGRRVWNGTTSARLTFLTHVPPFGQDVLSIRRQNVIGSRFFQYAASHPFNEIRAAGTDRELRYPHRLFRPFFEAVRFRSHGRTTR